MREWLRDLREQRKWTQKVLAEQIGVSDVAVTLWETGKNRPSYDKMCRLADLLGPEVHARFAEEAANRHSQDGQVA